MTNHPSEIPGSDTPLDSWKEIAAYLQRDVSTAMRWEKSEELPVHRHQHSSRASVYAYPSELDAWRTARRPDRGKTAVPPARWPRLVPAAAGGAALLAVAAVVLWGPIMKPPGPLAEAANVAGKVTIRQVWAGEDIDILGSPSPDGRFISFVDWSTGDLALRDLQTGENRRLTNKGSWSENPSYAEWSVISPNGKQVAYTWLDNEKSLFHLRLIGIEGEGGGSRPKIVYSHEDVRYVHPQSWFPDGERILTRLFRADDTIQIGIVHVADGSLEVLKTFDWQRPQTAKLSPDGRYIAYDAPSDQQRKQQDIFLLAADGGSEVPLVEHSANDTVIGWTPDGGAILFSSDRSGRSDMWRLPLEGGKPAGPATRVKSGIEVSKPMGMTAAGELYYGVRTGNRDIQVAEVDFATGRMLSPIVKPVDRYVGWAIDPAWSPDGKSMAYISRRASGNNSSRKLVIRELTAGAEREIENDLTYIEVLHWTPDGRSLLTSGRDAEGRHGIVRIDAVTGKRALILRSSAGVRLKDSQASPDGKAIYYLRGDYQLLDSSRKFVMSVRTLDLASGQDKEIYRADASRGLMRFRLSPDGTRLAIGRTDPEDGSTILEALPVEGGEPLELYRVHPPDLIARYPAWTPDSQDVLFVLKRGESPKKPDELWTIPALGGEPQKTEVSADQMRMPISVHPDGRRVAFSAGQDHLSVWVMANFLPEMRAAK